MFLHKSHFMLQSNIVEMYWIQFFVQWDVTEEGLVDRNVSDVFLYLQYIYLFYTFIYVLLGFSLILLHSNI